ncbi:MAG TPA: 3-oxoacyl-[acyl-carrier-protein] synthase III C-terminal domain-containing protein, partial [Methanosarcinales archaeon]|nr:3-oxoacyl-[acyl-carrier-protein] synthase III C-terminal domain-containing protein [Methanosarcinales archaeon]
TQSPDYFMPPTSNVIQGALGLKTDMICMDINQGCAGFIIGLFQAFMLLDQHLISKVVLLNADILSRKTSKKDRNSNPIVGDAASITIIERSCPEINSIHANIKMDGSYHDVLMIPAGGFKLPSSKATSIIKKDGDNYRSKDNLCMKGDAVFSFVMREVPPMIENLLKEAMVHKDEIDYFVFHQPNRFMLHKLADKLEVPYDKMPSNIVENFGNASGVSIPTVIAFNSIQGKVCMAGFGVGLTWGSIVMDLKLNYCNIIEI